MGIESLDVVGTLSSIGSNFQVMFPWVTKAKVAMFWFPSCKVCLSDNKANKNKGLSSMISCTQPISSY